MDITPDSRGIRERLERLPFVREKYTIPSQHHWAIRIISIIRGTNPNISGVVDEAIVKARESTEQELGHNDHDHLVLTRDEWVATTDRIGHVAAAAALASIGEALHAEAELEKHLALPDSTGPDN